MRLSSSLPLHRGQTPDSHAGGILPVSQSGAVLRRGLRTARFAAESRVPLVTGGNFAGNTSAMQFPDEYLFDGGDRAHPVHYDDFRRLGLDTEDTVVEYADETGRRHVKSTNRVAVYAPRFAAVRSIGHPAAGIGVTHMGGVQLDTSLSGLAARSGTAHHKQRFVPDAVRVRSRGSGIDSDKREVTAVHALHPAGHRRILKLTENFSFLRTGRLERTEEAVLAKSMRAAAVWSKRQYPVVTASTRQSGEVSARAHYEEYVGREDARKKPGHLRIVKLADRKTAQPGDVITFTIRYDNLGERELRNIRIVDNLTPRLDYVPDSAQSDRAGRLVIEDNLEGSIVLKFELPDPLPGGKGGVVTFQAKVK